MNPLTQPPLRAIWPPPRARGGFSLPEMLVIVFLIALLSAMGIIAYRSLHANRQLREGARLVSRTLDTARELAIGQSAVATHQGGSPSQYAFSVVLDLDNERVWIDRETRGHAQFVSQYTTPEYMPQFVDLESARVGASVATSATATITFDPDGSARSARITLREQTDRARSLRIKVYPSTGRNHIVE